MTAEINTVIIGGTFNPVHIGHMHTAEEAMKNFNAERVIFVPANIPAHKDGSRITDPGHRLSMLQLACRGSGFIVETCEIDRGGVSYSIDTVLYLKEKYMLKDKPGLLIGDDLAAGFNKWKNTEQLAVEAEIIIAGRNFPDGFEFGYPYISLDNLLIDVSSSDIRERIGAGKACRYLMPDGVYEYIIANNLYGE